MLYVILQSTDFANVDTDLTIKKKTRSPTKISQDKFKYMMLF